MTPPLSYAMLRALYGLAEYDDIADGVHGLAEYAFVESWRADHGVARQFGHDGFYHPGRKFAGQVKRALDRLVAEARAATEAEADRVEALHWSEVREALRRAEITGYDGIDLGSGEPRLTLEAWQGLVARLP